jgi:hypothetical protein
MAPTMTARELIEYLRADSERDSFSPLDGWIAESRRFRAFAENNRSKIRKKIRTAAIPEGSRSVMLELEVARRFVEDRGCEVDYERFGQGTVRGPDLSVIFGGRTVVNLEVTQVQLPGGEPSACEEKLTRVVCHKLGQMPPGELNVLVLAAEGAAVKMEDVTAAMKRLKERVERRDGELLARIGFAEPAEFLKSFRRLSGIMVWPHEPSTRSVLWLNPEARPAISAPVAARLAA